MKKKEFAMFLNKLNNIVKNVSLDTAFDDIVNLFDIINYINNNITEKEINKFPIKGFKGFLFIKPNLTYHVSLLKRDLLIKILKNLSFSNNTMNNNILEASKHETYYVFNNEEHSLWYYEHDADELTRKQVAYELYKYIKLYNRVFNPNWIR